MPVELAPPPPSPPEVTPLAATTRPASGAPRAEPAAGPGPPTGPLTADRVGTLGRRLAAWLVDLALILLPTAVVALSQTESSSALGPETATAATSWDRVTVSGTMHHIPGDGLWLTAAAAGLAALIVLALIPANVAGWSPGLRVAGLRVISTNGTRARLHQHLIRTVVGLADLAPFALPGLLGWIVATRSPRRQRLGDRAAGTVVVSLRHPDRPHDPAPVARTPDRWWQPTASGTRPGPGTAAEAARRWTIDEIDASPAPASTHAAPEATRAPLPRWSDEHQAWVVTAPGSGRLLRHDPGTDRWRPVA